MSTELSQIEDNDHNYSVFDKSNESDWFQGLLLFKTESSIQKNGLRKLKS